MAARPIHLFEAGVVTEQQFAGLQEAPATLAPLLLERLECTKHVRIPFNPRERWLSATREACRDLADGVLASMREGCSCAVIGGECTVIAGALSGALGAQPELTLIYIDAHGDFNTVATTPSHYIAGMILAHVCGRSVGPLLFPGSRGIAEDRVALVGARALDTGEARNLERSGLLHIPFDADHPTAPGLVAFARRRKIWLHVDIDVVDPSDFPAVAFPAIGGPSLVALADLLRQLFGVADVRGFSLSGYDARADPKRKLAAPLADLFTVARSRIPVRA